MYQTTMKQMTSNNVNKAKMQSDKSRGETDAPRNKDYYDEDDDMKYTLRVGDVVSYQTYPFLSWKTTTVTSIRPSNDMYSEDLCVHTSNRDMITSWFEVITSEYDDAPPKGIKRLIDRVNLEESSLSHSARQKVATVSKNEMAVAAYTHAVADVSMKLKAGKLSLIEFPTGDATENQIINNIDEDDEETKSEEEEDTEPLGSVGYKFEKIFYGMDGSKNKCWYFGEVIEIKYTKK